MTFHLSPTLSYQQTGFSAKEKEDGSYQVYEHTLNIFHAFQDPRTQLAADTGGAPSTCPSTETCPPAFSGAPHPHHCVQYGGDTCTFCTSFSVLSPILPG